MFIERFPDVALQGIGRDWEYVGWFQGILGMAENGRLPVFFADWDLELNPDEMPPPPPGKYADDVWEDSSTAFPSIPNDDLTLAMLPPPNASFDEITPFCLSFDGYQNGRFSIGECTDIADKVKREGVMKADMDSLRTSAFIWQRFLKSKADFMAVENSDSVLQSIRMVIAEIRRRLSMR